MIRFDQHLWHRFKAIAAPYWFGEDKWPARGLLALLVLLLLGQTGVDVLFNQLTGEFTSALAARDEDRFWNSIKLCLAVLIVAVPIHAFYYYVRDKLALHWRRWLTRHLLGSYFSRRAYFYFVRLSFNLMLRAWRLAFCRRIPWLCAAVDAYR
jgi:putative ATP-binding cassette transporter